MDHAALEYLKRRAAEEIEKANSAPSKTVASVHRAMADAYHTQIKQRTANGLRWAREDIFERPQRPPAETKR
jgi:hypothetical protein